MSYQPRYFSAAEFGKCTPSCKLSQMDDDFLRTLDRVRELSGIPLVLNCAYRSKEWDLARGRKGNSAHTRGKAADIRCNASGTRWKIVRAAIEAGVRRIGIGENFVHLDTDDTLPQCVMWTYY